MNQRSRKSALVNGAKTRGAGKNRLPHAIVGIGMSAGGLSAVTALLRQLPANPGMAFVVIQHLDPVHPSALPALLQRATKMPVTEAKDGMPVEANCVYAIPPNRTLCLSNRRIRLLPRVGGNRIHMPVDRFLESLAEEEADRGIAVILSGNGSDGTRGALAVKAAGGVTFAQDEASAKYGAMPAHASAAGCIDFVLRPEAIARRLAKLAGGPQPVASGQKPSAGGPRTEEHAFEQILASLRQQCGVDFSRYKRATIDRRIRRRMGLRNIDSLRRYADYLRMHAAETQVLFNDILIHVTGFFRDASVFPALGKKVFPRLLKGRHPDAPLRIWVPGCSSGEEVYSIAIALTEFLEERKLPCAMQLFGTDINLAALDRARAGFYSGSIAADVSPERLRRFFTKSDGGYRINKSIRELCVFARQNLVADPPFPNLDLISCRNVLIYLGPELQRRVFPVFHYALQPQGFLLLGAAETTGMHDERFALVDKRARIYARKPAQHRPVLTFGLNNLPVPPAPPISSGAAALPGLPGISEIQKQADRVMLAHYGPPGVVVNRNLEVLQFRGRTGRYLEHAHGEANLNLLKMARAGLVLDLRAAIAMAMKQDGPARRDGVCFKSGVEASAVNIVVVPFSVPPSQERCFLVVFETPNAPAASAAGGKPGGRREGGYEDGATKKPEVSRLQDELSVMRESLQATIEEQEATNEELRSANEEIMSSNEELQSTNEELETAKEEMQSTNEELTSLNDELENRNAEMGRVNNDLHNLLANTHIPIVMVGPDLRIRRFTTVAEKALNLSASDVGRPITGVRLKIAVPGLSRHIADVIDSLQTREVEVRDSKNRWWLVRFRPYRTTDHRIDGAVLAFVDIDLVKRDLERTTACATPKAGR